MPGPNLLDVPGGSSLNRKIQELQGRLGQPNWQSHLEELTEEIQGEFKLGRLLERVMDKLIALTRAQRGFLILVKGRELVFRVRRNVDRQTLTTPLSTVSASVARRVIQTGEVFISDNAKEDTRLLNVPSVHALGLMSILAVPFRYEGKVTGVVYLDNRTSTRSFGQTNVEMVRAFAHAAANAIRIAELVTKLKLRMRQVEQLNRKLESENRFKTAEIRRKDRTIARVEHDLQRRYSYDAIVGQSGAMQQVFNMLDRVIPQESTTLITGETGTGKELIARAIHHNGPRKSQPFVAINCGALSESLLESELFGHVKGAFTDASSDKQGLIRQAHGGTLFLDEVGEMSPALQTKLLRVIQERVVRPIGSSETAKVDVRWIAATHRDLAKMTEEGRFRKDLFYRLSVICIHVPPLRERLEDLPLLVRAIAERMAQERKLPLRPFDPGTFEILARHPWPGNVRELENVIERLLTAGGKTVTRGQAGDALGLDDRRSSEALPPGGLDLKKHLGGVERELVAEALRTSRNKSDAARKLRIDRTWFLRLLKKHGLDPGEAPPA